MKRILMTSLLAGVTLLQGCAVKTPEAPPPPQVKPVGMANPADVYCTEIGGKLNARHNADGQYSTCTLPSGQEIESWELFRRDHPVKK